MAIFSFLHDAGLAHARVQAAREIFLRNRALANLGKNEGEQPEVQVTLHWRNPNAPPRMTKPD